MLDIKQIIKDSVEVKLSMLNDCINEIEFIEKYWTDIWNNQGDVERKIRKIVITIFSHLNMLCFNDSFFCELVFGCFF